VLARLGRGPRKSFQGERKKGLIVFSETLFREYIFYRTWEEVRGYCGNAKKPQTKKKIKPNPSDE
jgi:hypothetical protein